MNRWSYLTQLKSQLAKRDAHCPSESGNAASLNIM